MADDSATATDLPPSPSQIIQGALPGILARAKVVINPYPFGLSDDSNLRITSVCSQTGVVVEVHYRMLLRDGSVKVGRFPHTPNTNRTTKSDDFALAGGYITNLSVFASAGAPSIGQVFVVVQLLNGLGATATIMGTMLQGYVTTTQGLGWPGSPIQSSTDGEPNVRNIVGTAPGAGANFIETCPTGARWELMSVFFALTTSAAAGTRAVALNIKSGVTFGFYEISITVGPSAGQNFQYAQGIVAYGAIAPLNVEYLAIPFRQFLRAGDSFGSFVSGLDAGDVLTAPNYQVREWLEVP